MWQRKVFRQIALKVANPGAHSFTSERVGNGIAANQKGELDRGQTLNDPVAPQRRTFWSRRRIAAAGGARITERHRYDGNAIGIVELGGRNAHPFAQMVTRSIGEGDATIVRSATRRLARNQQSGVL